MTVGQSKNASGPTLGQANDTPLVQSTPLPPECLDAISHLREAVVAGKPWPSALLRAMGMWTLVEEVRYGRRHCYLIQEEAFDWLLLACRLAEEIDVHLTANDGMRRLQTGQFLLDLPPEEVRELLGVSKYRAYLNYWYGVTVERSLQMAVREELRKQRVSQGFSPRTRVTDHVFRWIYGEYRSPLLERFRSEQGDADRLSDAEAERKSFIYWLFRLRLRWSEPVRIASDTRKALEWLQRTGGSSPPVGAQGLPVYPKREVFQRT